MFGQDLEAQVGPYGIFLTRKSENYNLKKQTFTICHTVFIYFLTDLCRSNSVSKNIWPHCEQSKLRGAGRAIEATYTALVG